MSDEVPEKEIEMVRPVRCYFCNGQMFYAGREGHVPEVRVAVHNISGHREEFYAHTKCWNHALEYGRYTG